MTDVSTMLPGRRVGGVMEPSGRLWPDGQFTVGYAPCGGMEREMSPSEYASAWDAHLGSSLPSNSHNLKDPGAPKRGTRGITSHGKRVLKNAVWRMQRLYGKRSLSFVTLTLPSVSYEESWYVSSNWSEILRVFYQALGRELERHGLPKSYAGCTELQPERSQREEHPSLHIHFVCVGRWRSRGGWALSPGDFRRLWESSVSPYLSQKYSWDACENVQMVKKDVSAYLGKYLSKGVSMDSPPRSDGTGWSLPTAWYNVNLTLRRWVLDNVRRHPELMEYLETAARDGSLGGGCHYLFSGVIEAMAGTGPHYFVGKLTGEAMSELVEIWKASVNCGFVRDVSTGVDRYVKISSMRFR